MSQTLLVLDRQASARVFPFGGTGAGTDALVTINKGTAATSTVVLDVKASANIAGDLNLIGNLNITGQINETSVTNLLVTDLTVTFNRGGTTPADDTSGIKIEGTSATVVAGLYYRAASATKWSIGNGTTQVDIADISTAQTFTNKSISGSQITSAVANATLAANVTTNANLTGVITSVGNATSIGAQTGTGTTFVVQTSPTLTTPNIGAATGTSLAVSGVLSSGTASSVDGIVTWKNAASAFTQSFKGTNPGADITYLLPTTAPSAGQFLQSTAPSSGVATLSWNSPGGGGTVTTVSVTTANGVSGTVANPSTTPAITITLGAITPTSVAASGTVTGSNLSGTNTGDQVGANPTASIGLTAVNGSASTFMRSDGAPALSQSIVPTWTGTHTFLKAGIGSTSTDATVLSNTTAATVGAQQFSPRVRFVGQGWKTNATAGSQQVEWYNENRPVQGTANPSTNLVWASIINGASAIDQFVLTSAGNGTFTGTLGASNLSGTNTGDQTSVTGNSGSTTLVATTNDNATNATEYLTWVSATSGNNAINVSSTKLTFNPSTGNLSATTFTGSGSGLTGTASSLTAGTVTTNANLTGMVTSVGNATTVVTNANLTGDVTSSGNATTLAVYHRETVTTGTQDSSNKVFTIANTLKTGSIQVFMNGQLLNSGSSNDFVYNGTTTVTFQAAFTAPASTDVIKIYGTY